MPLGEFVSGVLFYLVTLVASLVAAWLVVARRFSYMRPLPRLLAWMVVGTGALMYAEVIPAALGILSRWTAAATALGWLALAIWVRRRAEGPVDSPPPVPASSRLSVLVAAVTVGAVLVYELARLRLLASHSLTEIDMLSFHLPGIARFIQTGSLWRVDQFLPGFATAQYPNNGDFLLLGAIIPWRDLAFVRFVPIPFFALSGVATYALGVELGAARAAAATMAAAATSLLAYAPLALEGLPDPVSLALFVAALTFLARARRIGGAELPLAGLAFGLALGTKWYAATGTAVVLAAWVVLRLAAGQRRELLKHMGMILAMVSVGGGLWLLRNWIESGNPIYPKQVSPLGLHLFAGSKGDVIDKYGYTIANYLTDSHALSKYIWPGFRELVGPFGIVVVMGLVVSIVGFVRERVRGRQGSNSCSRTVVIGAVLIVLGNCVIYAITPGSAYGPKGRPIEAFTNIRWLMPGILVAAAVAARAVRDLGRAGIVLELGALYGALYALGLTPDPLPSAGRVVAVAIFIALAAFASWQLRSAFRAFPRAVMARPWAAGTLATLALALVVVVGRVDQVHFDTRTYAPYDPAFAWIDRYARAGDRIGIAGAWDTGGLAPTLPAFGPRLGNYVAYVGDPARASLHLPASESTFAADLRRGRYDVLVIGAQLTGHTDVWARRLGYVPITGDWHLLLFATPDLVRRLLRASHAV